MKSQVFWVFLLLLWVFFGGRSPWFINDSAWAKASSSKNEYDFSWLDPDKKVYVLQNRKFRKDGRLMISVMPGLGISEPYRDTVNLEGRIGYYLSESLGIEAFYTLFKSNTNGASDALSASGTTLFPVTRAYQNQYGALLQWVPWYAKINVFNAILYFDWYFTAGVGKISYEYNNSTSQFSPNDETSKTALFLGFGQHFHLSQSWGIRLDLSGALFRSQVFENSGDTSWFSNFNYSFGLGYRF